MELSPEFRSIDLIKQFKSINLALACAKICLEESKHNPTRLIYWAIICQILNQMNAD